MKRSQFCRGGTVLALLVGLFLVGLVATGPEARGQAAGGTAPPGDETITTIDADFFQQVAGLERSRLQKLERLAAKQDPARASATYEHLLRLAIAANLFQEAEPAAAAVLAGARSSAVARGLAHLVKTIAAVDRGAYDQALAGLRKLAGDPGANDSATDLPTDELIAICDAYYQRLIHAGKYDVARDGLAALARLAQRPELKEFLASHLRRLERVGKPAPPIRGTDLGGKPYDLEKARGKVVLVVFWATWSVPSAGELAAIQQAEETYRDRGFQVVGINVDPLSEPDVKPETMAAHIRHFVVDNNVRSPTLINGAGDQDFVRAYGVTEIPANVLVGKDGTVTQIDLVPTNLNQMIARAIGE